MNSVRAANIKADRSNRISAFYLNPFVTREKGRQGYRRKRYRSNGTNSTLTGIDWRKVIALSNDNPRKASSRAGLSGTPRTTAV